MDKAMAHLGRGLAYGKQSKAGRSSFGAGTEGTTDSAGMIALRTLVSEKLTNRLPKLAKEVGVESNLIKNATLDELCGLSLGELSPGYDSAALIAAALFGGVKADRPEEENTGEVVDVEEDHKRQKLTGHFSVKGTKLDAHQDQKKIIGDIIRGTRVLGGADFGEMKEIFVFTDVSLNATGGKLVGDIDDKFALCLLAHAAPVSKLERIVVVISARKKSPTDDTTPDHVVRLFTEKLGTLVTTEATTQIHDGSYVRVIYSFTGKIGSLVLDVCYDHGVSHLKPDCVAVKEFDKIMKPKTNLAVAVVIGPISEHTAEILNDGSKSGAYALVVGVSVTEKSGVNGGGSQSEKQKTQFNVDAWTKACCGGLNLDKKKIFELGTADTRKLLMTHAFLANHNMESVVEIKQAHASVWRNHLGFVAGPDPAFAFRAVASNGQTTSAHGPETAATIMSDVFAFACGNQTWPEDKEYFAFTRMGEKGGQINGEYLAMAKRYVAWCFVNLGAELKVDPLADLPKPTDAASTKKALDGIDIATVVSSIAAKSTENSENIKLIEQVVCSIRGDGVYTVKGDVADVRALYVTSVVATYMRLLSTELVLNKIGIVGKIEWVGILGAKNNGLYPMSPKIVGVAAV
jgi:hypothetical protein